LEKSPSGRNPHNIEGESVEIKKISDAFQAMQEIN
jgi:hypothetical protein